MTHTPGPWGPETETEYGEPGTSWASTYVLGVKAADGRWVCKFDDDYGTDQMADAHLIAVAPDLLEACQKAESYMQANDPEEPFVTQLLRAAIAKATGEGAA
jgi:hypothetical protein